MKSFDIVRLRLHNQRISTTTFKNPADVVGWLGAVQSQDYAGAKWALGQRIKNATDEAIAHRFPLLSYLIYIGVIVVMIIFLPKLDDGIKTK